MCRLLSTSVIRPFAGRSKDFGSQHDVVASSLDRFPDNDFGLAISVHICSIDKIDAVIDCVVEDFQRLLALQS